jgi:hypothetical protein
MRRFNHIQKSPRLLKQYLVGGFNPSEKYEFVSWDDEIPNIWKVIKAMFQTTNQPCLWLRSPFSHHFSQLSVRQVTSEFPVLRGELGHSLPQLLSVMVVDSK